MNLDKVLSITTPDGELHDISIDGTTVWTASELVDETDTTAGDKTIPSGAHYESVLSVGGKSVVFSQIASAVSETQPMHINPSKGSLEKFYDSNMLKLTLLEDSSIGYLSFVKFANFAFTTNHIYIAKTYVNASKDCVFRFDAFTGYETTQPVSSNVERKISTRFNATSAKIGMPLYPNETGWVTGDWYTVRNFQLFDLTQMFGAGNEPTVEEFEAMFPADYYPYNEGEIVSAGVSGWTVKDASSATTETVTLPTSITSLTGYGWSAGSVYNEVDFENKRYIQRVGRVDLGSLNWGYSTLIFGGNIGDMKKPTTYSGVGGRNDGMLCDKYPCSQNIQINENMDDDAMLRYNGCIYIKDSAYTDTTAFKTAMNGVMLYYELAEPIITDLSDILDDLTPTDCEAGGSITYNYPNKASYNLPVPNSVLYKKKVYKELN